MGALLAYSFWVGCILIPLYFVVKLGLSGTTLHSFTRKIILGCYGLALLFPLVSDIEFAPSGVPVSDMTFELPAYSAYSELLSAGEVVPLPELPLWIVAAISVYAAGLVFFVIREMVILIRMFRLFSRCDTASYDSRWKLLVHDCDDVAPFSWADRIVISRKDLTDGGEAIIAHESAHLERFHSVDLLLAEIVAVLTWYNPASWLMRDELCTVHEYETDDAVLRQGFNARDYQLLLIKKAVGSRFPSIANSLDHSNLSKRIKMMLQKRTSPGRRWIAAATLPAVALTAVMLSADSVASTITEIAEAKVTEIFANEQAEAAHEAVSEEAVIVEEPIEPIQDESQSINVVDEFKDEAVEDAMPSHVVSPAAKDESAAVSEPEKPESKENERKSNGTDEKIFTAVERMPQYPGGDAALLEFVRSELKYPEEAVRDSIQGRVIVGFVVKSDGSVTDVQVLRGKHPSLDQEAVRVVKAIDYMIPGTLKGEPVSVRYVLPLTFRLKKKPEKPAPTDAELGSKVFTAVEQMPQYPGGEKALIADLMKNLKYPDSDAQGRVIIRFVVTSTGSVGDVDIIRSLTPEMDKAAEDAVKTLHFEPGRMNGKPVNVYYTIPVTFKNTSKSEATPKM
ncbi:M56 family metallopeptidase [uncultured Muribaculum sp.]|uniref:M56 family metallopeptidase n=1 Tax=uncultured Muribaculum sp. TaxID=1918613 RepID=UPI00259148DF|nr:M56 family metallopeptidase [uncultured Muribaculum sp.]